MPQAKPKHVCHEFVSVDVDGVEVDLPVRLAPGEVMHYVEYIVERPTPNTLVLGYLIEDGDCGNPLEDSDGSGRIYSAHRHAGGNDHYDMQQALGLNRYWDPDTDHELVEPEAVRAHPEIEWLDRNISYAAIEPALREAWNTLRDEGKIGNPYAVLLDCYDHGGQHWSLSGGGPRCRFDTAGGAGVWVPDPCCLEHIEAFAEPERRAEAVKCAEQALVEYNAWLAGECYGVVVCTYERASATHDFDVLKDSDECWRHIGTDYAKEALRESVDEAVAALQEAT